MARPEARISWDLPKLRVSGCALGSVPKEKKPPGKRQNALRVPESFGGSIPVCEIEYRKQPTGFPVLLTDLFPLTPLPPFEI